MTRSIYRLGAELLAVRRFMEAQPEHAGLYHALQAMTSAVEVRGLPTAAATGANADDRFVAEIALGLLCRGWPTLSSPLVEERLLGRHASGLGLRADEGPAHEVSWRLAPDGDAAPAAIALAQGLLPTEEGLEPRPEKTIWLHDSLTEMDFFQQTMARILGPLRACVEWQRPLESMASEPSVAKDVVNQRADFTLELGAVESGSSAVLLNIEVDGPDHWPLPQRRRDADRDGVLHKAGWIPYRIPVEDLNNGDWQFPVTADALSPLFQHPVFLARYGAPLLTQLHGVSGAARGLLLTPHAVARVQLAMLLALRDGALSLAQPEWRLLVREREVPCAQLALADLTQLLGHLCELYGFAASPQVELSVVADHGYASNAGEDAGLPSATCIAAGDANPAAFDLALDVSVLCRATQQFPDQHTTGGWTRLRTAPSAANALVLRWSSPRAIPDPLSKQAALEYFLRTCFRKRAFRDGQLPIIERALRRQSVIGLLPTGAGKSLTYQLPALLTPGVTFVIDPIKSLMQDQVDNLRDTGIDSAVAINSDQTPKEKAAAERKLGEGARRFAFISPERLQIQGFRDTLTALCHDTPVAFAVIDETHCVSEWGHDFRTAYLNLGRHVREFMKHDGKAPPVIALTGTASRAVLIDVQREIDITDPEAIIEPDRFDRPELHYVIERVASNSKRNVLLGMLTQLPARLDSDGGPLAAETLSTGEAGGILFCPHVNGQYGVFDLANFLKNSPTGLGGIDYYCGEVPKKAGILPQNWPEYKAAAQKNFKSNELSLLAATKAFGMGIDKPNIRYTIHLGAPESVEALTQEMGRAGRDRRRAMCHVIFSDRNDPDEADPIHRGIGIKEAKRRMEAIGWGADDAGRMLFLHTNGYSSADREAIDTRLFFMRFVQPHLESATKPGESVTCAVHEGQVRRYLRDAAQQRLNDQIAQNPHIDWREIKSDPLVDPSISTGVDRLVYRLSLLGIVTDYTVSYEGEHQNVLTLNVMNLSESVLTTNLQHYIRRYRPEAYLAQVDRKLEEAEGEPLECVIRVLCDFIYDEIEAQRREAIWNVRNMLRQARDGEHLRQLISNYFDRSVFRPLVYAVARSEPDAESWTDIARLVQSESEAAQLLGQSRRALESATDNPALHFLSGIALAATDEPNPVQSAEDFRLGVIAEQALRPERAGETILTVLNEFQRLAPSQLAPVVGAMVSSTDTSVPGAIEAAEAVAMAALPRITEPAVRHRCAQAIVRRLRRSHRESADLGEEANRGALTTLQAGSDVELDSSVHAILQEFRETDPPLTGASAAHTSFAASAFRYVRDDALKRRCATLILSDLHQSVQRII